MNLYLCSLRALCTLLFWFAAASASERVALIIGCGAYQATDDQGHRAMVGTRIFMIKPPGMRWRN